MTTARLLRQGKGPPPLLAKGRFGRYKDESGKAVRGTVIDDEALKAIMLSYEGFMSEAAKMGPSVWRSTYLDENDRPQEEYEAACRRLAGVPVTSEDVERFSILIRQELEAKDELSPQRRRMTWWRHEDSPIGIFLSALVAKGSGRTFRIHPPRIATPLSRIGFRNSKDLHIHGDAGVNAGEAMEGGTLTVHGSVQDGAACRMQGGLITIEGSAGQNCGAQMRGGKVILQGDAGALLGARMEGGEIVVQGNAGVSAGSAMKGGRIVIMGDCEASVGARSEGGDIRLEGEYVNKKLFIPQRLGPDYMKRHEVGASVWHRGWPVRLIHPSDRGMPDWFGGMPDWFKKIRMD